MKKITTCLAIAGAIGALTALAPVEYAKAASKEKCYGVSMAGQNDCKSSAEGSTCSGSSTIDYDGLAWKLVPKGDCESMDTPYGKGSLKPIENRPPKNS